MRKRDSHSNPTIRHLDSYSFLAYIQTGISKLEYQLLLSALSGLPRSNKNTSEGIVKKNAVPTLNLQVSTIEMNLTSSHQERYKGLGQIYYRVMKCLFG